MATKLPPLYNGDAVQPPLAVGCDRMFCAEATNYETAMEKHTPIKTKRTRNATLELYRIADYYQVCITDHEHGDEIHASDFFRTQREAWDDAAYLINEMRTDPLAFYES